MELPKFKYHPDPVATGNIVKSDECCECCGEKRGYIYNSTIYAEEEIEFICPWCISNGEASTKFDGMFSDDYPLVDAGISESIINEVTRKTPGYNSWQQEEWQSHCDDACEFHGDATKKELEELKDTQLSEFLAVQLVDQNTWENILDAYEPGGNPAIYKFICKHCNKLIYTMDFT